MGSRNGSSLALEIVDAILAKAKIGSRKKASPAMGPGFKSLKSRLLHVVARRTDSKRSATTWRQNEPDRLR